MSNSVVLLARRLLLEEDLGERSCFVCGLGRNLKLVWVGGDQLFPTVVPRNSSMLPWGSFVYVFVHEAPMCVACTGVSENSWENQLFSFYQVGPGDQIWVVGLGDNCFCFLRSLLSPGVWFLEEDSRRPCPVYCSVFFQCTCQVLISCTGWQVHDKEEGQLLPSVLQLPVCPLVKCGFLGVVRLLCVFIFS